MFAARIGAIKDVHVFFFEMRRPFKGHGSGAIGVGGFNFILGEPNGSQQIKRWVIQVRIGQAQRLHAEIITKGIPVKGKFDVKGRHHGFIDLCQNGLIESFCTQTIMVDPGRAHECAVTDGVIGNSLNFFGAIAKGAKANRHRAVDDFKITTTCKFFEFDQRKIRLDPGGITIHDQTDGACWRDDRCLGIAIAVFFTQFQCPVPCPSGGNRQIDVGAVSNIQRHRFNGQAFIAFVFTICGTTMVADNPQHGITIVFKARERPQFFGHFCGCGIRGSGQNCRQGTRQGATIIGIIAHAASHQEATDIGVTKSKGAKFV